MNTPFENIYSVLSTIRSRCQILRLKSSNIAEKDPMKKLKIQLYIYKIIEEIRFQNQKYLDILEEKIKIIQ